MTLYPPAKVREAAARACDGIRQSSICEWDGFSLAWMPGVDRWVIFRWVRGENPEWFASPICKEARKPC